MILGDSGTGKTTSLETLDPKETFIICSDEKSLPFKGWKKRYQTTFSNTGKLDLQNTNLFNTTDVKTIKVLLEKISSDMPHIKIIIIDTITNLMIAEYMRRIKEKGYEKFTDNALDTYSLLTIPEKLRANLTVVILGHTESNYDSEGVMRTSFKVPGGKLIGQNIVPESLFTSVLYSEVVMENNEPKYYFITQNNGKNTCKSPKGMFDTYKIPNDLAFVIQSIAKFENED